MLREHMNICCVYEARMTPPLTETWCLLVLCSKYTKEFFQFLSGTATSDFSYHTRVILPLVFAAMVDVIFADVAQPDQARIVSINAQHFLKNQGNFVISIKVCLSVSLSVCQSDLSVHAGSHIHSVLCSLYLFTTPSLDMHCSLPTFSHSSLHFLLFSTFLPPFSPFPPPLSPSLTPLSLLHPPLLYLYSPLFPLSSLHYLPFPPPCVRFPIPFLFPSPLLSSPLLHFHFSTIPL